MTLHRNWSSCRICMMVHTNPMSSSICPSCGLIESEKSKATHDEPPHMSHLQEAIEEVKRVKSGLDYDVDEIDCTWTGKPSEAIAAILNAVVKGELK